MSRTFKVRSPHMRGDDVREWQATLNRCMATWDVDRRLELDGDYGVATRDLTATVLYGLGIEQNRMADGVTPELRVKVRHKRLTPTELVRYAARAGWRRRLRERHARRGVHPILAVVDADSWGWAPGHDGIDLICRLHAPAFAIVRSEVVRADAGGWWGKGAPSPAVAAKGDGIVILRALVDSGPIREGMNLAYGHAEQPRVRVGQIVDAGDQVAVAGMANAPHLHFMVNVGEGSRGVGDRDPRPVYEHSMRVGR